MYAFSHHELQQMVGIDKFSLVGSWWFNNEIVIKDPNYFEADVSSNGHLSTIEACLWEHFTQFIYIIVNVYGGDRKNPTSIQSLWKSTMNL